MKIAETSIVVLLLSIITPALTNSSPPTWNPYSPYTGYLDNIDEVHIGYGDWCVIDEGPHPGIDFGDPDQVNGTMVLSPCGQDNTVEWAGFFASIDNGMVVVVAKLGEDWGWGVAHLDEPVNPASKYNVPGAIPAFEPMEITSPITQVDWRHVHLYWVERLFPPTSTDFGEAYFNPFNYIMGNLIGYDEVMFKYCYSPIGNGLWFMPDECEIPVQFPFSEVALFQGRVFGKVDVGVSPYSAFNGEPDRDSVGVNTVGYKILWQNPYTEEYEDLDESSLSIFGGYYRLLVSMNDGEMTLGDSDEYRALFVDGNTRTQSQQQNMRHENAYILTNSGTQSMGFGVDGFNSGWDNVWTDSYDRDADWDDEEYLRGAWDTRLGNTDSNRTASINEQAVFPDGRYAFAVMALSQGTAFLNFGNQEWSERVLPCEDPHNENSPVTGVIVDNFIPSIEEVIVYSFRLGIQPANRVETMYDEVWNVESSVRERTSTAYGYLPSEYSALGVAVRYSEIMDPENMGYYWFTGERAEEVVYTTEDDRSRWLRPVEGFRNGLGIDPLSTEAAYWQSYETSGDCSIDEIGYVGRLALHIGDLSTPLVVLDLAGNEMDYDPSTIATPRDPVTGQFNYSLVEQEPYDTEIWGNHPFWVWNPPRALVDGFLDDELVATVDLESIGLGPSGAGAIYVANNRYWCGFWMRHSEPTQFNEYWPIVDFQGEYTELIIHTEFPVGQIGMNQYWFRHSSTYPVMSADTRYIWAPGYTVDWLHTPHEESKAYVYCLDSETGYVQTDSLCVGWVWDDTPRMESRDNSANLLHDYAVSADSSRMTNASFSEILSVDSNGVAEVRYGYYTEPNPEGLVQDTILIEPFGGTDDLITTPNERPFDTPVAEITAETTTNPVHDVLTVNLLASSGSRYEIDLYDISGRRVLYDSGILTQDRITIDNEVNYLPSGVYLLRISTGDMEVVRTISIIH